MTDLQEIESLINKLSDEQKSVFYTHVSMLKKYLQDNPEIGLLAFAYIGIQIQEQ